ncbi:MAG: hypothetical protein ACKPJH_16290, partial [Dolichospermum sp.]
MRKITDLNNQLSLQRKTTTAIVGTLLAGGFMLSLPLFNDTIKHNETLYCNLISSCKGADIKRGVSFLIDRERRNQLFDNNIKIIKILHNEDPSAVLFGIISSAFLLGAYGVSKALTNHQEKLIHAQFKQLKIDALENDLLESTHVDLFNFSQQSQAEITKQAIARQTQETIQAMKSDQELQLDHLNGTLQGELVVKQHQLQSSELTLQTTKNNLEILQLEQKINKANNHLPQAKQVTPNEELKNILIE